MKVIFLDIDGVLNCQNTVDRFNKITIGIDNNKVELLKKIIDATNAKLVLISSWKTFWNQLNSDSNSLGNYLDYKLSLYNLCIFDKTKSIHNQRGLEIYTYLQENIDIDNWIVIDDSIFDDYEKFGIKTHLVKTNWTDGLTNSDVTKAISMLSKQI